MLSVSDDVMCVLCVRMLHKLLTIHRHSIKDNIMRKLWLGNNMDIALPHQNFCKARRTLNFYALLMVCL